MQKHWGIFLGMLKKVGIFFGRQYWSWDFLGIKYEPLSDPPVIKICGWGPWGPSSLSCDVKWIPFSEHFVKLEICIAQNYILFFWQVLSFKGRENWQFHFACQTTGSGILQQENVPRKETGDRLFMWWKMQ